MLLPSLTLEELRARVKEADALLRVARQHARDAHDDPEKAVHASARIQSICSEVDALFPGLSEPSGPDPAIMDAFAVLQAATPAPAGPAGEAEDEAAEADGEAAEADDEAGEADEDADDADEADPDEWGIDFAKLASAIENEALMSRFPEPGRSAFKQAALYLVEAHERHELFGIVIAGFEGLSELASKNVEDMRGKLAMALTLESLAQKRRD
ncbi:MAG: hypothetical protein ABSE49_01030 [Polyangiaceae bacterium]|jgi:hypothetical protein